MIPRLVLLAGVVLSAVGLAQSTTRFDFPGDCVDGCVGSNGCGATNAACMCMASRGSFLVQVVGCMSRRCNSQLNGVDANFLDIMQRACSGLKMPIPADKVQAARRTAASLVSKTPPPPPPTQTASRGNNPPPIQTSERNPPPSEIPTLSDEPPPPPDETAPPARSTVTQLPPGQGPTGLLGPDPTRPAGAPPSEPTDSSPFAAPNAAPPRVGVSGWIGAGLPLVAALGML